MPYIAITTGKSLTNEQKSDFHSEIGRLISVIPGKSEGVTMISINDGVSMRFRGEDRACAYIDVKLYSQAEAEAKKNFTEKLSKAAEDILGIPMGDIFITYTEFSNWGSGGNYK